MTEKPLIKQPSCLLTRTFSGPLVLGNSTSRRRSKKNITIWCHGVRMFLYFLIVVAVITGSFCLQLFSVVCIRCLDQYCCWSQWWRNNAICSLCMAASSATIQDSASPGWPGCGSTTPHRFWHQVRHDLTTHCTQWHFSNFPSYFYFQLSNLTPGCSFSAVSHTNNNVRTSSFFFYVGEAW